MSWKNQHTRIRPFRAACLYKRQEYLYEILIYSILYTQQFHHTLFFLPRTFISFVRSKQEQNRKREIKKKKLLSDKTYEQAIGFLRIPDGENKLDKTAIHPESYHIALALLTDLGFTSDDIGTKALIEKLNQLDMTKYQEILNTDQYTLEDVVASLKKPNLDPRDEMPQPLLKSDILEIDDLKVGMKLQGTVRNVVDFGAFIDIGLHNDGLAHISKLTDKYIKHPSEVLSVGDIVDCYVEDISKEKGKVSLSLLQPQTNNK